jgi:hypothetical protein
MSYVCRKCNYKCEHFSSIKSHFNKKKLCISEFDDKYFISSLVTCDKNIEIEDYSNYYNLLKYKDYLFNLLNNIDKKKLKKCEYCNEIFNNKQDLKNHIILNCFPEESKKDNFLKIYDINNKVNVPCANQVTNQVENETTTTVTTNTVNYTNVNVNINNDNLFGDEDMSKYSEEEIKVLEFSKYIYTKLLETSLKDEIMTEFNETMPNGSNDDYIEFIKNNIEKIVYYTINKLNKSLYLMFKMGDNEEDIHYFEKEMKNNMEYFTGNKNALEIFKKLAPFGK